MMRIAMRAKKSRGSNPGFLMSLEAALSLVLLLMALQALALYQPKQQEAGGFFLCNDAAIVLVKTGSFSDQSGLEGGIKKISSLAGECVEASSPSASASSCPGTPAHSAEKLSFSFPVWQGSAVETATVSCWRA